MFKNSESATKLFYPCSIYLLPEMIDFLMQDDDLVLKVVDFLLELLRLGRVIHLDALNLGLKRKSVKIYILYLDFCVNFLVNLKIRGHLGRLATRSNLKPM